MATVSQAEKERLVVMLDPAVNRLLRIERAETRKPVSEIVEEIIREHFASRAERTNVGA